MERYAKRTLARLGSNRTHRRSGEKEHRLLSERISLSSRYRQTQGGIQHSPMRKYEAERQAVEDALLDISDEVIDNKHRLSFHQLQEIKYRIQLTRHLLNLNLPLKAKREVKSLDRYVDTTLYNEDAYCV